MQSDRRCVDLVRDIRDRGITISVDKNGFLRASPWSSSEGLLGEMKVFRSVMVALATGFREEGYRRGTKRAVRVSCDRVLETGRGSSECLFCGKWALWILEGGVTGLCVSRAPVGEMDFSEEVAK